MPAGGSDVTPALLWQVGDDYHRQRDHGKMFHVCGFQKRENTFGVIHKCCVYYSRMIELSTPTIVSIVFGDLFSFSVVQKRRMVCVNCEVYLLSHTFSTLYFCF